jgi:hypothetical protein
MTLPVRRQRHRGLHPKDDLLFGPPNWPALRNAIVDLHYLRSRGYGEPASLRVVGDRYRMQKRQRFALERIVSNDEEIRNLRKLELTGSALVHQLIAIDGFNLLIFAEVLFSGGLIFECLDGTFRDIASIHGSYHQITETRQALSAIGNALQELAPAKVIWYLDQPVSNSGKMGQLLSQLSETQGWNWTVEVVPNPDENLVKERDAVIITTDRQILTKCQHWFNFSRYLMEQTLPGISQPHVITLRKLGLKPEDFAPREK